MPPFAVLHVCMGNICRSPMAERLLVVAAREYAGDKALRAGLPAVGAVRDRRPGSRADDLILVRSAGTGGWHAGDPMDPDAARQVLARGGDVDTFLARKLRSDYVDSSDLVLTATGEQQQFVLGLRPDAADRTFVLGELGRLLHRVDPAALPPFAPTPEALHARGVALVAAAAEVRGGRPPESGDDLDDPWGRGDAYFSRIADQVEAAVRPLAAALFNADPAVVDPV